MFVWAVIFSAFAVPREFQHRVLFLGVVGALVMRAGLIAVGAVLVGSFSWVLYVFGAFLVLTGIRMLRHRTEHADIEGSRAVAWLRRVVPHTSDYEGTRLVVRRAGRWVATPLLLVLVVVEATDLVFAVDSVPAIFAITQEPFLVFTANAFAILGLRAMYFLLADLMHRFVYLKTGLSLVLVWVGVKMLLLAVDVKVPTLLSLGVVAALVGTSVVWSLRATRSTGSDAPENAKTSKSPKTRRARTHRTPRSPRSAASRRSGECGEQLVAPAHQVLLVRQAVGDRRQAPEGGRAWDRARSAEASAAARTRRSSSR